MFTLNQEFVQVAGMATRSHRRMLKRNCRGSLRTRLATILSRTEVVSIGIPCIAQTPTHSLPVQGCDVQRYGRPENKQTSVREEKKRFLGPQAGNHNPQYRGQALIE